MEFTITHQSRDCLVLAGELEQEEPAFAGHFPEARLLPGVVQVDWAVNHQPWYQAGHFQRIDRLKFVQVTPPGFHLTLRLLDKGEGRVSFEYRCGEHITSSGLLVFGSE